MAHKMLQLILFATVVQLALSQQDPDQCIAYLKKITADLRKLRTAEDCKNAGFEYVDAVDGCYSLVTENMEWNEAGDYCKSLHPDAHLLVINDEAEQDAVADWFGGPGVDASQEAGCKDFSKYGDWGIVFATAGQRIDLTTESDFVWRLPTPEGCTDNTSDMEYINWGGKQPDYSKEDQACMVMGSGRSFEWNDYPCDYRVCSICELDI